jgi:hypothetical protein
MLKVIDVTEHIGQLGDEAAAKRVRGIIAAIMSSIRPDTWFPVGGDGSVRSFFNDPKKHWYLVVSHPDDISADLQTIVTGLKTV